MNQNTTGSSRRKSISLAEIQAWRTNWKSRGKGRDPITHETGIGIGVARQPNPEKPLDFN